MRKLRTPLVILLAVVLPTAGLAERAASAAPKTATETAGEKPADPADPAGKPPALDPALLDLLKKFRKSPGLSADFTEEKKLLLLRKPLVSSGTVYYEPSAKLARHVAKPRSNVMVLRDGKIIMKDGKGSRVIDTKSHPAIQALVGGFLYLLGGDASSLSSTYDVKFTSSEKGWSLNLEPKGAKLRKLIQRITLSGKGIVVSRMILVEGNGDTSTSTFRNVRTDRKYTDAERTRYFQVPTDS